MTVWKFQLEGNKRNLQKLINRVIKFYNERDIYSPICYVNP